jgi:hypothetical protein
MGPHGEVPAGPKVVIVSSAEIAEQDTLSADYWVNRRPGESWTDFRVRRQIEALLDRAERHETIAAKARADAARLRGNSDEWTGLPGAPSEGEI